MSLLLTAALLASPELALTAALFDSGKAGYEISGLAELGHELIIVSDEPEHYFLYRVEPKSKDHRMKFVPALDLTRLAGWDKVQEAMKEVLGVPAKDRRLDLEGVAACPGTIYLASERARQILVIEDQKAIKVAPIDFAAVTDLFAGGPNAGFEGVTADCAGKVLYVAKEREPRRIFKIDMATWKIADTFEIAPSDRAGQRVINPFTAEGLFDLSPDVADLFFQNGFLYALERNTYEVTKIDPATKQVVSRVSFYKTEKPLYETGEPFGLAEALFMSDKEIWIGLDNNQSPATDFTAKKYGYKGDGGVLLTFTRPSGF